LKGSGGFLRLYKKKSAYRGPVAAVLIFLAVIGLFRYGFGSISGANGEEDRNMTQAAIQKAVVNCYAIEGVYPPDVKYLEDHYGVVVNHSKYVVSYELAGSNIMPSVEVQEKGGGQREEQQ
jgi:hypothetical protein